MIRFGAARCWAGQSCTRIGEPERQPNRAYSAVAFRRRGVEMRLVLAASALQNDHSRCTPR